ncbi:MULTISPECIES: sugar phosphate isomerase/epimerase [unclassified Clostridium]|uniref:sugar phosphate isomerase/epimerase family protein n=1 Tax=unclassified Clostridium TaxID=2614128 RepID=UPI00110620DA|nr:MULTISPECIES: sugar phosphate isomerase/epimerase [unclassified Clostridium]
MEKMKAGVTGFMPKDVDYLEQLQKYAKLGYSYYENARYAFTQPDPKAVIDRVHDMGLKYLALGTTVHKGAYPDVKELVRQARIADVHMVGMYHSGATFWRFADRPDLPEYDEAMLEIENMEKLAVELGKEGIDFFFHNHDQEFRTTYNGVPLFWMIAAKAEHVKFEVDLGWAHYAGWDPAQLIRQLGDRVVILHVKDYTRGENCENKPTGKVIVPRYTTPGTGLVDLEACFHAGVDAGVKYAVIEQDMLYHLSTEESVRTAYAIMKETGYVE